MAAPTLSSEAERLEALRGYNILDTAPEDSLDDITRLAAHICGTPIAAVSLVDADRQFFKSILGLAVRETPRDVSFCAHTILQPTVMVVPDAREDDRFSSNPLVTGAPNICFYAGAPLVTEDGHALGSLCVIDQTPRLMTSEQQDALRVLARQTVSQFEMKRQILIHEQTEQALQAEVLERKRAESELETVLAQSEQVLSSIPSILVSADEQGIITTWNSAAAAAFGLTTGEQLGRPFLGCAIQWEWDKVRRAVELCNVQGKPIRLDNIGYVTPSGCERSLGVTINPIHHYGDGQKGFILLAADITDRQMLESKLVQAQKLESIGQLAAGIAHEINTPIQYVGDNTRFLRDAMGDLQPLLSACRHLARVTREAEADPLALTALVEAEETADLEYLEREIPQAISQTLDGIDRVTHIVRAMKDFSHPGPAEKVGTDLNRALESTITVASNEWKYVAEMETEFDLDLPLLPCLPAELNQVFLNMIINAAHAIGDVVGDGSQGKGKITVSTHRQGDCLEVRIRDTGTGMPEEVRRRIFDPFFTTKEVGRGTGQGLSISHAVVVEMHRGNISVETKPGQGTVFIISLPLTETE